MPDSASPPRGRFAPSPTGPLHFGSLIAALGSFLEARQQGGEWLVRIEDADTQRARTGAAAAILRALDRYQLHWDGSVLYQSHQTDAYQTALERLFDAGLAYPCACSRRELANHPRARDGSPIYSGRCRTGLSHADRPFAIRLRVTDTPLIFRDAVQGEHRQRLTDDVGDFAIRRADGLFAYQLAVVVDDAAQGVTQVVRGCDLLDSTPRQIYLQQALGLPTPRYAHLPVATDRRGRKLSKQTGATALDLLDPAPALWAALDFLGQAPPPDLRREPPATILAWALAGWRLDAVPATPSRRWLDADVARHVASDRQESDRRAIDKAKDVV
ncbi:MAG: tRNA glutamyl-Q(34) synthetase GluQRS [Candidatus Competibacteraceae bacterium]|nr:tRNA glutamyl-Q(34) synthetase GluQRS [Candidatus Competibacteraceae bacterium]MBK8898066.1 tRNA glutamyl-Q(34) synthetase GluQRS [Candidatus Competibacteraceae bacterium]MBK9951090.1 tRNA glutamyl-Q(34) synthetase GluQRS [Candidatus Competibacteraceae bacterium]